jgi:hypothetical protein
LTLTLHNDAAAAAEIEMCDANSHPPHRANGGSHRTSTTKEERASGSSTTKSKRMQRTYMHER